jgi:hypothetical protein
MIAWGDGDMFLLLLTGILNLSQFKHHSKPVKKNRTAEADTPRHLHLDDEGGTPLERGVSESARYLVIHTLY